MNTPLEFLHIAGIALILSALIGLWISAFSHRWVERSYAESRSQVEAVALELGGQVNWGQAPQYAKPATSEKRRRAWVVGLTVVLGMLAAYTAQDMVHWIVFTSVAWLVALACVVDFEHCLIPDRASLGLLALGLVFSCTRWALITPEQAVFGMLVGYTALYALSEFFVRLRGKEPIGEADLKLLAAAGAFVGPWGVAYAAGFAVLLTLLILPWLMRKGEEEIRVPFGPGLALGLFALLMWQHSHSAVWLGLL